MSGARLGVAFFPTNFPWLSQWVVERESRDETRIQLFQFVEESRAPQSWNSSSVIIGARSSVMEKELFSAGNHSSVESFGWIFRSNRSVSGREHVWTRYMWSGCQPDTENEDRKTCPYVLR